MWQWGGQELEVGGIEGNEESLWQGNTPTTDQVP